MMKYTILILTLMAAFFSSGIAFAQSTEVSLNVEYASHSIDVSIKYNDPQTILANAVKKGCKQLCNDNSCENECFQHAKLTLLRCVDENNIKCRPNQEKLITDHIITRNNKLFDSNNNNSESLAIDHHKALASKSRNSINENNILIRPDYYPTKPNSSLISPNNRKQPSSTLLLSTWRGNDNKKKNNNNSLLVDPKKNKLLMPSHVKSPQLLR